MADWQDVGDGGWKDVDWQDVGSDDSTSGKIKQHFKNALGGIDAAATTILSVPGYIAGGLAGLGSAAINGSMEAGDNTRQSVTDSMTVEPFTKEGKEVGEMVGDVAGRIKNELGAGVSRFAKNPYGDIDHQGPVQNSDDFANKMRLLSDAILGTAANFSPLPGGKAVGKLAKGIENMSPAARRGRAAADAVTKKQAEIDAAKQQAAAAAEPVPGEGGEQAFNSMGAELVKGQYDELPKRTDPMDAIKQQLDARRQAEIQQQLAERQAQMEFEVKKQQGLDFNAAERARQENAPVPGLDEMKQRQAAEMQALQEQAAKLQEAQQKQEITAQQFQAEAAELQRQAEQLRAQHAIEERQAQMEQEVKQRATLDLNAADRQRQEAAPVPGVDAVLERAKQQAAGDPRVAAAEAKIPGVEERAISGAGYGDAHAKFLEESLRRTEENVNSLKAEIEDGVRKNPTGVPLGQRQISSTGKFSRQRGAVDLPFKRASIFVGKVAKDLWRKVDITHSNDIDLFPWSIRGREIARREVMDKYLTLKDLRDASRVYDSTNGSSFDKQMSTQEYLNNLLDERSGGQWLDEMDAIKKTLPNEFGYARDEFGEPPEPPKPRPTLRIIKGGLKERGAVGTDIRGKGKQKTILDDLKERFAEKTDMIPDNPDPKQIIEAALAKGKDSNQLKYTESGATLAAMKRESPLVEGGSRIVQNAAKRGDMNIKDNVFPVEKALRKLSKEDVVTLGNLMKQEMLSGKRFDPAALETLSARTQAAYAHLRDMFDDTLRIQNEARVAKGQEPITAMEAYLSSRWNGDFRRPVYEARLDSKGNPLIDEKGNIQKKLVWYLAADTKRGIEKQWQALSKERPDLTFDPKEDHVVRFYKRETDIQSVYSTIVDLLGRDDPAVQRIKEFVEHQSVNEAASFLGQEKHFKEKTGVRGFMGDRPGEVGTFKESLALFQQQIQYAKNAYRWSEMQKAAIDLKPLFSDPDLAIQQPQNIKYLKEYFKDNIGYGEARAMAHAEDSIRDLGISPHILDKYIGGAKSFFILQKIGVSAGYTVGNLLQTFNAIPHIADLAAKGYLGNPLTTMAVGIMGGIGMALGHFGNFLMDGKLTKDIKPNDLSFYRKAFKYAEDNGVTARSLYDESPIESSFSVVGRTANFLGKSMTSSEAFVRSMAFLSFAEFIRSSKKGRQMSAIDILQMAEERTNAAMVDYRAGERPMVFTKLGVAGNFLNTLQTYPMNWYNQWNYFGREAMKGNVAPMAAAFAVTYATAGMMGVPGFNDLDKLYQFTKDHLVSDSTYVKMRNSEFFNDPKAWLLHHYGDAQVYGYFSDKTGWGMTSRTTAPGFGDMIQAPGGPVVDLAKQGYLAGKAAITRNSTDVAQSAMASAPSGLQGALEQAPFMQGKTFDLNDKGERIYQRPGNIEDHLGIVKRSPQEETLRNFGLRSQREVVEREMGYRYQQGVTNDNKRAQSIPNAMYDAVKRGNTAEASDLYSAYVKLTGKELSKEAWNNQVIQNYTTSMERAGKDLKNKPVTAIKDFARMQAIMDAIRDEYQQKRQRAN